jgi:hypothetical protein
MKMVASDTFNHAPASPWASWSLYRGFWPIPPVGFGVPGVVGGVSPPPHPLPFTKCQPLSTVFPIVYKEWLTT